MNMTGNQNVFRNIILVAAITNVCLNLVLIPSMGILGAAIAAAVSESIWNISSLIYIKVKFGKTTGYLPFFLMKNCNH
jgi:O-antigen/teichoic acid export membrane protein